MKFLTNLNFHLALLVLTWGVENSGFAQSNKYSIPIFAYSADLKTGYTISENDRFGQNGSLIYSTLNSQFFLYGVPLKFNMIFIKEPDGSPRFEPFSISFSKSSLDQYLLMHNETKNIKENFENKKFKELTYSLSNYQYLDSVSSATKRYRELAKDSIPSHSLSEQLEMDTLKNYIDRYWQLRSEFQKLREKGQFTLHDDKVKNTNTNPTDSAINTTDEKLEPLTKVTNDLSNLNIGKSLRANHGYNGIQAIFSKINCFNLGYDVINQSIITVNSYQISGLNAEYKFNRVSLGGCIGKHRKYFNTIGNGTSSSIFKNSQSKESILQFRLGLNEDENNTTIYYTAFRNLEQENNIFQAINNQNVNIISILTQRKLTTNSNLKMEISRKINPNHEKTENSSISSYNALNVLSENEITLINAKFKLQYMNIGSNYYSPGNKYLTNSYQNIDALVQKSVFKNFILIKAHYLKGWNLNWQRIYKGLELICKLNSKNTISYSINRSIVSFQTESTPQIFTNYQLTYDTKINKSLSIGSYTNFGVVEKNNLVESKDYLLSALIKIKFEKLQITPTFSFFNQVSTHQRIKGFNYTLSVNRPILNKVNFNLMFSLNKTVNSKSSTLSSSINYMISKNISIDINGNTQNYFQKSILRPYDYSWQGRLLFSIHF